MGAHWGCAKLEVEARRAAARRAYATHLPATLYPGESEMRGPHLAYRPGQGPGRGTLLLLPAAHRSLSHIRHAQKRAGRSNKKKFSLIKALSIERRRADAGTRAMSISFQRSRDNSARGCAPRVSGLPGAP